MEEKDKEFLLNMIKDRPQELCKMCGNCCRVSTTKDSYQKLLEKKSKGDEAAIDFLNIFVPFESIEDAKKENAEIVENILHRTDKTSREITFYKCKYLQDNNKCGDYENRPLLCKLNPLSAWSIVPPNCGFTNWLESQKEQKINEIKHQKENLNELEQMLNSTENPHYIEEITKRINKIQEILEFYKKYGADNW